MFSENNRISGRQAFRLLTFDLLGIGTLLLPQTLGYLAGADGIFSIALGVAAGILYLQLLSYVLPEARVDFPYYVKQRLGKWIGGLVLLGCFVYFVLFAGYTAYIFADVVLAALLREESFYLVIAVLMALSAYGLLGGLEGRARVYELLFWFTLFPLALMLFAALDEIQTDYWTPVFTAEWTGVLAGGYEVFRSLAVVFLLLFLRGYMTDKKKVCSAGRTAILLAGGIYAVLYLILLGIFGADALAQMKYPAVTLMSTVKTSGGFLKRTDAFIFAVWFFSLYALLTSCIFYGGNILIEMQKGLRKRVGAGNAGAQQFFGRKAAAYAVVWGLTLGLSCVFYKKRELFVCTEQVLRYAGTPFLVLVPLLLAAVRFFSGIKGRKRARSSVGIIVLLLSGSVLTGCHAAELEERNFPIEAAVQDSENFAAEWKEAGGAGNRVMDYSHLKVMVLSTAFLENEEKMQEFLHFMELENEVPRNTYVVAAKDADELLSRMEDEGESLGNYLEEQFENVSEVKKKAYPTLGMLYQEKENRCEMLLIPYVTVKGNKPAVDSYYVWKRGTAAGLLEREAAMLFFFTQNEMDMYTLPLPGGGVASLTGAHNEIGFREAAAEKGAQGGHGEAGIQEGSGSGRQIVVKVRCSGELSGGVEIGKTEALREIAQYMNALAGEALSERQLDLSGSYKKLAGSRRDWYEEYRKNNVDYEKNMTIVYEVEIDWINL